ncbi:hypothetical protein [Streptomyces sp. NPDC000880]
MPRLIGRRSRRIATACVALTILVGCGGNTETSTGGNEASPLNAQETKAILPDAKAMPGWKVAVAPAAYSLTEAKTIGVARCYGGEQDSCENVRFTGASSFLVAKKPIVSFMALAYEDVNVAKSAYDPVWEAWRERVPEARNLNLGEIGERSDAVTGLSPSFDEGSKGVIAQVRVGTVILLVTGEAAPKIEMADSLIANFATTFAKRARQAQDQGAFKAG